MKKLLLALVLSCAMVLGIVAVVSADNGPHGSFTATTDACANCHRAHSAQSGGSTLLVQSSPEALCISCHNGQGAGTDVEDGVYHTSVLGNWPNGKIATPNGAEGTDGASLFGGGFTNTLMATAWSGAITTNAAFDATSRPATSAHSLGVQGIVYGSGGINATEATMTLECTSCHDPHGNAGFTMTANGNTALTNGSWTVGTAKVASYRLLRFQPQGSGGFTAPAASNWSGGAFPASGTTLGWTVPDNYTTNSYNEWYTLGVTPFTSTSQGVTTTNYPFAAGDYNFGSATGVYLADGAHNYVPAAANVAYFCAQCHDRYFTNTRLRNDTDVSAFCGAPTAGVVAGNITLTQRADADGVAPWIHPVDPVRCVPVVNATTGALTSWGDAGPSGDNVHKFMHTSGDVLRASSDGSFVPTYAAMTAPTSVGRTCVACHVAHGTSAQMGNMVAGVFVPGVAGQANQVFAETGVASSTLLRMDNRSLCLRCHASSVGFTVAP